MMATLPSRSPIARPPLEPMLQAYRAPYANRSEPTKRSKVQEVRISLLLPPELLNSVFISVHHSVWQALEAAQLSETVAVVSGVAEGHLGRAGALEEEANVVLV